MNHSVTASAMVGQRLRPRPAARSTPKVIASRLPNSVANARAAVGPTWRIDNATNTRHSGCFLAVSKLASNRLPLADNVAAFGGEQLRAQQVVFGEGEQITLVVDHLRLSNAVAAS